MQQKLENVHMSSAGKVLYVILKTEKKTWISKMDNKDA
jgi:hypothetical protein